MRPSPRPATDADRRNWSTRPEVCQCRIDWRGTCRQFSLGFGSPAKTVMGELLLWGRHPARDLSARVEAELVHDAANVGCDGGLRDEQAPADLPVAQTLGDQLRDLCLPLRQYPRSDRVWGPGSVLSGFAESEAHRHLAAHVFA